MAVVKADVMIIFFVQFSPGFASVAQSVFVSQLKTCLGNRVFVL